MKSCHLCRTEPVRELFDFGMQPISNRYLMNPDDDEYTYPMAVSQCSECGLIQISNPVPPAELLPPYDWITYNEPEEHLDHMVDMLCNLPGLTNKSQICGFTFKDDSSLTRLKKRGFKRTWRIDPKDDLGIDDTRAGIETVQHHFTDRAASRIVQRRGRPDVVIARHILEHAQDLRGFMKALKQLVSPKGYIIVEVPDSTQALKNFDYATLWEEHCLYFTPETFQNSFAFGGFSLVGLESYSYPFENSLVGIMRLQGDLASSFPAEQILEEERLRAQTYFDRVEKSRKTFNKYLSEFRHREGKIALFGAGHLGCAFVNLMGLKSQIEFFVDDNPNKRGLFMPGSHLPIYGSSALVKKNVKLCLLGLNPLSEERVILNNSDFTKSGGIFASIFPGSKHSMRP